MKLSELVEKLKELQTEHGDVVVYIFTDDSCCRYRECEEVAIDNDGDCLLS